MSKPMSEKNETIEERAKRICKRLDYIDAWNAGGEEAIELIEDLMAERKSVDLDALFPKEVMERDMLFGVEGFKPKRGLGGLIHDIHALDGDGEYEIVAYRGNRRSIKELARVCVRLRLTVQKVED